MISKELCAAALEVVARKLTYPAAYAADHIRNKTWRILTPALGGDLLDLTDSLFSCWPTPLLADNLRRFLDIASSVALKDPPADSWQPALEQVDDLWQDCLAVAYYRLYAALLELDPAFRLLLADGDNTAQDQLALLHADIFEKLALVAAIEAPQDNDTAHAMMSLRFQERRNVIGWRLGLPELDEITTAIAAWNRLRLQPPLSQRAVQLFSLLLLLLREERTQTPEPVGVMAAGLQSGLGLVSLAVLTPHPASPALIEPALWSRHRSSMQTLHTSIAAIEQLLGITAGSQRYRVAFNPPGVAPASAGHIGATQPAGNSIGFALGLATYAAQHGTMLGRFVAGGEIDAALRVLPMLGIDQKLKQLAEYNKTAATPFRYVLLPAENLAEARRVVAANGYDLQINQTLAGEVNIRRLQDVIGPGILHDGLAAYISAVAELAAAGATQVAAAGFGDDKLNEDLALARVGATRVLADIATAVTAGIQFPGETPQPLTFLLCIPYGCDPAPLVNYLIYSLAKERATWAEQLPAPGGTGAPRAKPPAPIYLEERSLFGGFEAAIVSKVGALTDANSARYAQQGWRGQHNEYALILLGNDNLIADQIAAPGGFLHGAGGRFGQQSSAFLILVANSIEQMQRWATDLAAADQQIDEDPATWYRKLRS